MNLPQAKIQLEKIISLYKSLSADEKNISAIERDLMLNYIRQLYETFLEIPANATASTQPKTVAPPPPPAPKPEPPKPVYEAPKAPPPPPPVYEQPKPAPVEAPKPAPVYEAPKPVYEQPKPVYEQPVAPPPPPRQEAPKPTNYGNSEVESLFEEIAGKELSDRLSNAPVADLTKAFGLNDRLLTQNELFGGNKSAFDETIKDLNNTGSFDTAKGYLIDLATRFNWTANDDRKKQAKSFIKLVRRRFK
jgi:hypothetical protein